MIAHDVTNTPCAHARPLARGAAVLIVILALAGAAGCCCPGGPAIPTASSWARLTAAPAAPVSASADAPR